MARDGLREPRALCPPLFNISFPSIRRSILTAESAQSWDKAGSSLQVSWALLVFSTERAMDSGSRTIKTRRPICTWNRVHVPMAHATKQKRTSTAAINFFPTTFLWKTLTVGSTVLQCTVHPEHGRAG